MKIHARIGSSLLALAVLSPLAALPLHVQAQQSGASAAAPAAPRIDGFDVEPVRELTAGHELDFTLYGSPGGTASVQVGDSTGIVQLEEVEAGVYEGTYTISRRDRITAKSTATANLRLGNRVASSVLDDSLLAGAPARWPGGTPSANGEPRIERFDVDAAARLEPGAEMFFTLEGTPGGTASLRINGVPGKIALEETSAGTYEGAYVIRHRDRIAADTVVTGNLRIGSKERSRVLGQQLADNSPSRPRTRARGEAPQQPVAAAPAPAPACANCGVVESVNVVEHKGDGSLIGKIGGGVAGAVIGNQIGSGNTRTIARVLGAAGGVYAGNEIEKRIKTTKSYEVIVRLSNGGSQVVSYPAPPAFGVGSRVRIENGTLVQG